MLGGVKAHTPVGGKGIGKLDQAITLNIDSVKQFDSDLLIESYIIKD